MMRLYQFLDRIMTLRYVVIRVADMADYINLNNINVLGFAS